MTVASSVPAAHSIDAETVMSALGTTERGLTEQDAAERLKVHGANLLPEPPSRGVLARIAGQFHNILIYVLIGSAAITLSLGHLVDTGVILAVVVANAVIGVVQEGRAETAMDAIRRIVAPRSIVLRDGRRIDLHSAGVVPGDIVLLEPGAKVPADLRLVRAKGLAIDEAILTGESVPVEKSTKPAPGDAQVGDRTSMAFSGTLVTSGMGRGVAVATGTRTEIGQISTVLGTVEAVTTPIIEQMDGFGRRLTFVILSVAGFLLAYGYHAGLMPFDELFMVVVGLSVAAIPEGLPAVLTIALAVGVRAMARRNAIVRRLPAIDTLGSVTVICTDKTGTLTRNEMTVATLAVAGHTYAITGEGYAPEGEVLVGETPVDLALHPALYEVARVAALCNDAALHLEDEAWHAVGDPMEAALLALAAKIAAGDLRAFSDWVRTDAIPFETGERYMAVLDHDHRGHAAIHMKGAPERVLSCCALQRTADGGTARLDPEFWFRQTEAIAAGGQRVIGLAAREVPSGSNALRTSDIEGRMVFLGLAGLIDPPRSEAAGAVEECRRAGIAVKMVTGDHGATAAAIAHRVGLRTTDGVLTGVEIDTMSDAEFALAVGTSDVFARTTPVHKLRLVSALQAQGHIVAMTGDGVNDAPALKRADAGIAMGLKGSDAAKEAAVLVLADDNFTSIVAAVREGRTVYENLRKVISFELPTSAGEALTIVIALFLGLAMPISPVQVLWINLVTGVTLGLALAFERTGADTMLRAPRPPGRPLLSGTLIWHVIFVSALFAVAVFGIYAFAAESGHAPAKAQSMAVNMLAALEIFHLLFVRNFHAASLDLSVLRGTPIIWACIAAVVAVQAAATYAPPVQAVLGTAALGVSDVALIIGVGAAFFVVLETEKWLRLAWLANR